MLKFLCLALADESINTIIAKQVIEVAQTGVRNPQDICQQVIARLNEIEASGGHCAASDETTLDRQLAPSQDR